MQILDISPLTWNYPENDAADLAVSELIGDAFFDGLILGSLDVSMLLTQEDAERVQLGIGEELICTGLFYRRQGGGRNIPIVRFGNIAAMPEEPLIDEDTGLEYDAFLAEIRSIGGLSGSPVFARLQPGRKDAEGAVISTTPQWFWLGVIRGHWRSWEFVAADVTGDESKMLNLGIALVTPAWEALEVLNGEDYVKERKEAERQIRKAEAPTKDAVVGDDEFERFEDLTRKLVNVPKKEIDEKRREGF